MMGNDFNAGPNPAETDDRRRDDDLSGINPTVGGIIALAIIGVFCLFLLAVNQ